tara:strand:+ start:634 stop:942 length:309 start_codon:yes stop_codon:yes gene_type:complete
MIVFIGEVGRLMPFDTGVDLTGNTEITALIKRPDDTTTSKTRVAGSHITVDDAATGQISWRSLAADFNQVGEYFVQVKVEGLVTSGIVYSPVVIFTCEQVLS